MKKLSQNSQLHNDIPNPEKPTFCDAYHSKKDLFGQFGTHTVQKTHFCKMDFNLKKTTLNLTANHNFSIDLPPQKTNRGESPIQQQQTEGKKPSYLSSIWQQINGKTSCSQSYIDPKKGSAWAELSLRKTESSQTQSSVIRSVIFGNKIDDFTLIRLLGRGRFGSVFLAKDKKTGFMGAIKILQKCEISKLQPEHREKMIRQLTNEIKLQSYINHPNIIKLYTFFHDAKNIYLFLELGTDGHLLDLLDRKQHLQEETTSVIVREVTRGVRYMHSRKIIHRDIKLENIVLTCGMAKICDFGWTIYESKNLRETICGTPIYLSPQVLRGKKYDHKIDVWAIGTLAHELAVGDNPFQVRKNEDLQKIVTKDFQMKSGSPELRSFIGFILRKDPERRPDAEILMKHPFITRYKHIETAEQLCESAHS